MGRELGRFLEQRRAELGMTRRQLADVSDVSYPYLSQLETGEREPALKAMRKLAPALRVPVEELAARVAGGDWTTSGTAPYASMPDAAMASAPPTSEPTSYNRDKVLLSLERRLRDVPPLERIALLNELIAAAVDELSRPSRH